MFQDIQGMQNLLRYQGIGISGEARRQKVKQEFLAIFYKELLKEAFKSPDLSSGENSISFGSDMLVDQLAMELAQSRSFSGLDLFPNGFNGTAADNVGVDRVVK